MELKELIADLEKLCELFYVTYLQKSELSQLARTDEEEHINQLLLTLRLLIISSLHDLESTRRELKQKREL